MQSNYRFLAAAAFVLAVVGIALAIAWPRMGTGFSSTQRTEVEKIIREYLIGNPDILKEVVAEAERRQAAEDAVKYVDVIKQNSTAIFNSTHQVTLGNLKGDVTMVEFFDYNCGFCKRALADMMTLMKADPKLRVVLKEFPVLGEASVQAAQVAVAVRMQDTPDGQKYLDFHRRLLEGRNPIDKARALAVVKEIGLDVARAEQDMASAEVRTTLEESFKLADQLGINGTPSYVIGASVVVGAVGVDQLREAINTARCGKPAC
jgi:protein-disulfide isomerase